MDIIAVCRGLRQTIHGIKIRLFAITRRFQPSLTPTIPEGKGAPAPDIKFSTLNTRYGKSKNIALQGNLANFSLIEEINAALEIHGFHRL